MADAQGWLAELRALCEKATPGPWRLMWEGQQLYLLDGNAQDPAYDAITEWTFAVNPRKPEQYAECDTSDQEFIAAARTALPRLLDVAEAATQVADALSYMDGSGLAELRAALAQLGEGQ